VDKPREVGLIVLDPPLTVDPSFNGAVWPMPRNLPWMHVVTCAVSVIRKRSEYICKANVGNETNELFGSCLWHGDYGALIVKMHQSFHQNCTCRWYFGVYFFIPLSEVSSKLGTKDGPSVAASSSP